MVDARECRAFESLDRPNGRRPSELLERAETCLRLAKRSNDPADATNLSTIVEEYDARARYKINTALLADQGLPFSSALSHYSPRIRTAEPHC
jgi:hypothetical protein